MSIVQTQEFWLGNLSFMNDSMELNWFKQLALKGFDWAEPPVNRYDKSVFDRLSQERFEHVYCGCFSTKCDDLSQWRGYADDGRGVAVGFDVSEIIAANDTAASLGYFNVVYDEETQRQLVRDHVASEGRNWVRSIAWIAKTAPIFKNPAFSAEEEVRLVLTPTLESDGKDTVKDYDWYTNRFPGRISFRTRDGGVIPYVAIKCPTTSIKALCLGPRHPQGKSEDALRLFLKANRIDVEATRSVASYRSS